MTLRSSGASRSASVRGSDLTRRSSRERSPRRFWRIGRLVAGTVLVAVIPDIAIANGGALPPPGFSDPATYVADARSGAAERAMTRGTLVLRPGRHAETKFVITPARESAAATSESPAIAGNIEAAGFFATFADSERDCRLRFAFHGSAVVVAQSGSCGFVGRTSVAGVYRRS